MPNPYAYILQTEKAKTTAAQKAMRNALIDLLQDRSIDNITVKELCSHAFVARSTFYAYYQTTREILEEIENDLVYMLLHQNQKIMERGVNSEKDMLYYSETLRFVNDNKKSFYTLLVANTDYPFIEKWKNAMKYHFWERLFKEHTAKNSGLILELVSSSVISAYSWWLKNPYEVDLDGIYSIISSQLTLLDYET